MTTQVEDGGAVEEAGVRPFAYECSRQIARRGIIRAPRQVGCAAQAVLEQPHYRPGTRGGRALRIGAPAVGRDLTPERPEESDELPGGAAESNEADPLRRVPHQ